MLKTLSIKNYAIIDCLEMQLGKEFTIITGETGAGKSILLGALGLIIGKRADTSVLFDEHKKCTVEATFDIAHYDLTAFFETNDLDYEKETIIRREITANGKSRAFINDTPVTLNKLQQLGENLIDIHSQHQSLSIEKTDFQFGVIDAFANTKELLSKYQLKYLLYKQNQDKLKNLSEQQKSADADLDYYQFQYNELKEANIIAGEELELEEELKLLSNAEGIRKDINHALAGLQSDEGGLSTLNTVLKVFDDLKNYNSSFADLYDRLNSTFIELEDITRELEQAEGNVNLDPERLEIVSTRLDGLNRLMQKHRVSSCQELQLIAQQLEQKLESTSSLSSQIVKLESEIQKIREELFEIADKISIKRKKGIPKLELAVNKLLAMLNMPNASLKIAIEDITDFNTYGTDDLRFLFRANKGGDFQTIGKVISGGELSRLMLSIKAVIANVTVLPSIIFDEIDTGVSGEVADKMGHIMQKMAADMQVIAITHLPQIASKGTLHFRVYKDTKNAKTVTGVEFLAKEKRVNEIAQMLSGSSISEAAIENAKELLK